MSLKQKKIKFINQGQNWTTTNISIIFHIFYMYNRMKKQGRRSKGWWSGESRHLPPICGLGSNSGINVIFGLSLLLVLSFAPRGFSPGTPVFPSPQKPEFPNSNSTRIYVDEEPLCGCTTSKSLFILFYSFKNLNAKKIIAV